MQSKYHAKTGSDARTIAHISLTSPSSSAHSPISVDDLLFLRETAAKNKEPLKLPAIAVLGCAKPATFFFPRATRNKLAGDNLCGAKAAPIKPKAIQCPRDPPETKLDRWLAKSLPLLCSTRKNGGLWNAVQGKPRPFRE